MKKRTPFLLLGILSFLSLAICTPNVFAQSYV